MRVLFTTRGSAGHLLPLVPIAEACLRAGHEVLVAAQDGQRANVDRAGLACAPVTDPDPARWGPLMARLPDLSIDEANDVMLRDFFADIDTAAALPDLDRVAGEWRPDVLVRESWEFAATLVAARRGIPLARVGLGLAEMEALTVRLAAPGLDAAGIAAGLPADPGGDRLHAGPYLTSIPATLEPSADAAAGPVHRLALHAPPGRGAPADPGPPGDDPLVLFSFGSVAPAGHMPFFPDLYRAVLEVLAGLDVRVLATIGEDADPAALGPVPANVRVAAWVPQDEALPHAAAVLCHGGHGSTLGALAHGVPLVLVPLFSTDQWANAAAVARAGAGLALDAGRATRRAVDLPPPEVVAGLGPALRRVLGEPGFRERARALAGEMAQMAPVGRAVELIEQLAEDGVRP